MSPEGALRAPCLTLGRRCRPRRSTGLDGLVATVDVVLLVTVVESMEPLTFTPMGLPASYTGETGVIDGSEIQWNATPVRATADEILAGDSISTGNFLEIGCFAPDALPSTTVGEQVLVFASKADPNLGPESGLSIEFRIADWMSIGDDGLLQERIGLFGLPPLAPFLVGQPLDDVVTEIRSL